MKFKTLLKKASKARMDYFHKTHYLHYYETFAVNDRGYTSTITAWF